MCFRCLKVRSCLPIGVHFCSILLCLLLFYGMAFALHVSCFCLAWHVFWQFGLCQIKQMPCQRKMLKAAHDLVKMPSLTVTHMQDQMTPKSISPSKCEGKKDIWTPHWIMRHLQNFDSPTNDRMPHFYHHIFSKMVEFSLRVVYKSWLR